MIIQFNPLKAFFFISVFAVSAAAQAQSADRYYSARTPYTDSRDAGLNNTTDMWGNTPGTPGDEDSTDSRGSLGAGVKDGPTTGAYTDDYDGAAADSGKRAKITTSPSGGRSVGVDKDSSSGSIIKKTRSATGSGTSRSVKDDPDVD